MSITKTISKYSAILLMSLLLHNRVSADNIYIMDAGGYNGAGAELIAALEALGHTVTIGNDINALPNDFVSACVDPAGYHWLCFFGINDFSALSPEVSAFIADGGKVYYNYEVSCCVESAVGAAAMVSAVTGLSVTTNAADYIALGGWTANLGGCLDIEGNAYRCFDGLPAANQLNANGSIGSPDYTDCTNFGFFFTGTDIPGNTLNGSFTGMGDINMWYDGGEPWSNGGSNPINLDLLAYFFPNETTTCHLATSGCAETCPYANVLGPDATICAGESLTLDATSPGATYLWHDNTTLPSVDINQAGTYWVEVSDGTTACTDTIHIQEVVVTALGSADITICQGLSTTISANGGGSYSWTPVATLDDPNAQAPEASPLVTTTYTVTVTVSGCSDTDDVTVTVVPADLDYNAFTTSAVCTEEGTIEVSQVSGGLAPYTLELNGVAILESVPETLPAGDYDLVIADISGCSLSETITVPDESYSLVVSVESTDPYCSVPGNIEVTDVQNATGSIEYLLNALTEPDGVFEDLLAGSYDILVRDDQGCEGSASAELVFDPGSVSAVVSVVDPVCITPGSVEVTGVINAASPFVIFMDGNASLNGLYPDVNEGVHEVQVTDADGCVFEEIVTLTQQSPAIVASVITSPVICETLGRVETVEVSGGTSPYSISIDELAFPEIGMDADSGMHIVEIADVNGCAYVGEFYVDFFNHTEAVFTANPYFGQVPIEAFTSNESVNADTYEWWLDDVLASQDSTPSFTFLEPGDYNLELIAIDTENGCRDSMNYIIYATPPNSIYVPTGFTPDNDGINDVFYVKGENIATEGFELLVFNRYGDVVWRAESPEDVWTGNHREGEYYVQDGVYNYFLQYKFTDSYDFVTTSGHITVIR